MSDTMSDTSPKSLSDKLSSIFIIICIVGMCVVVYGISEMIVKNKDYPLACKVLYLSDKKKDIPEVYLRKRERNMFAEDQGDFGKYDYLYK